ncbi:MAG: rubredoxin [Deltaproteobacteria bacterium]
MESYRCVICDYIYDPVQGDPANGVAPGTSFFEISDDWVCPVCGMDKGNFEKV